MAYYDNFLQTLVAQANEVDLFSTIWGKQVRLTNAPHRNSKPAELQNYINYNSRLIYDEIRGVVRLDRKQPIYSVSDPETILRIMNLQ